MMTFTCHTQQALEIGGDVEVTVVEVAPGEVRLGIRAPGRCVTRLDVVPLPLGAADLRLVHLEGASGWPYPPPHAGNAGGAASEAAKRGRKNAGARRKAPSAATTADTRR